MSDTKVKIVGVPGFITESKTGSKFGCGVDHMEFIRSFGAIPRILSPGEPVVEDLAAIYLPGGADLNPMNYGEIPSFKTQNSSPMVEWFYKERLMRYIEKGVGVFAVCLGHQILQSLFGGKLIQDMPYHPQSSDRWETAHQVWNIHNGESWEVNSHHHQGIRTAAEGFIVDLVYSPLKNPLKETENGYVLKNKAYSCIEAMHHSELPIYSCQFHPEQLIDEPFAKNAMRTLLGITTTKKREEQVV